MSGTIYWAKRFHKIPPDLVLILVASPVISVIMWSLGQIVSDASFRFTVKSFLINMCYVWLIALATRFITRALSQWMTGFTQSVKWIFIYVIVITAYFLLQTVILVLVEGIGSFLLILVVYSIGGAFVTALFIFYYSQWRQVKIIPQEEIAKDRQNHSFLKVQFKGSTSRLSSAEINWIELSNGVVRIMSKANGVYHSSETMKSLMNTLPEDNFFRVNRNQIIARADIKDWKAEINKTLVVTIASAPNEFVVSRSRSAAFRRWFEAET